MERASRKVLFKLEKVEGGIKILEDFELEVSHCGK